MNEFERIIKRHNDIYKFALQFVADNPAEPGYKVVWAILKEYPDKVNSGYDMQVVANAAYRNATHKLPLFRITE